MTGRQLDMLPASAPDGGPDLSRAFRYGSGKRPVRRGRCAGCYRVRALFAADLFAPIGVRMCGACCVARRRPTVAL